jgi:hypothetical protein
MAQDDVQHGLAGKEPGLRVKRGAEPNNRLNWQFPKQFEYSALLDSFCAIATRYFIQIAMTSEHEHLSH